MQKVFSDCHDISLFVIDMVDQKLVMKKLIICTCQSSSDSLYAVEHNLCKNLKKIIFL